MVGSLSVFAVVFGGIISYTLIPFLTLYLSVLETSQAKAFRLKIRAYNSKLSLASRNINGKIFWYICVQNLHFYVSSLNVLPDSGQEPKFSQIYIYDREHQIDPRSKKPKTIENNLFVSVQDM